MRQNELPREHHQSNERPVRASGYSRDHRANNQAKKDGFATPPPLNGRLFSSYVGLQAVSVLLNNNQRRAMVIQNLSADTVYIGIATPPAFDGTDYQQALAIPSGNILEFGFTVCPVDDIYAVSSGASSQIAILESTI